MASERCLSLASLDIFAVDATIVSIEQLAREEQPVEFFHYDYWIYKHSKDIASLPDFPKYANDIEIRANIGVARRSHDPKIFIESSHFVL